MRRLKASELKAFRAARLELTGGKCELCGLTVKREVADHSHKSGQLRGCICAGCNSLLGRVENNAVRYGVNLKAWATGLVEYLSRPELELLHPTYRTEAEKKELRRKRAKRRKLVKSDKS